MQSPTLMSKLEDAEKRKLRIESELAIQQAAGKTENVDIDELKAVFKQIGEKLKSGALANKKQIVDTYINKIEVFPDKAIVYLNFFPNITIDYSILTNQDDNSEELNKPENTGDKLNNQEKTEGCAATQPSAFHDQQTANPADDFHGEGGI